MTQANHVHPAQSAPKARLLFPDLARAIALIGMAIFHFTFDLQNFGFIAPGTIFTPEWEAFGRTVAGSFVFLAGVSLVLAHGRGLRARPFLTRLAKLIAAAALVSIATYLMMPEVFIYYGILHSIAVNSLIGALLIRLPWAALAALGVAIVWVHLDYASPAFNHPALWWLGLSTQWRPSIDFEPVLPWLAPFLWGMAAAKLAGDLGWLARAPPNQIGARGRAMRVALFAGRHTLPIYLIHQPVLFGATWVAYQLLG
jgi:uncharacterized membrane protein